MVFSKIKKQTSKLRDSEFAERARELSEELADELSSLTRDVERGEELTERVEETRNEDDLKKDISEQRNIFEEFEAAESDAMDILTLEEEEFKELHRGLELDIEREKQVESIVLAFGEEIDEVERLVQNTEEILQSGVREFNTQCFEQAKELGGEGIIQVLAEAKESDNISKGLAAYLGNSIEKLVAQNGYERKISNREKLRELDLDRQVDQHQRLVVKMCITLNEVLYELPGRSCVRKKRYTRMEHELEELQQLFEKFQEVAEEMEQALEGEEEIEEFIELEMEQLPESVEELRELGEELEVLGEALEEEEATEREVMEVTQDLIGSNSRQINKDAEEEVKKLENNLGKLRRYGHRIVAEAEELQKESSKLGDLEEDEEEKIEKILEKGETIREDISKIRRKVLHSDKVSVAPEDPERDRFEEGAGSLEMRISIGLKQVSGVIGDLMEEAEKMQEMSEEERQMELELTEKNFEIEAL